MRDRFLRHAQKRLRQRYNIQKSIQYLEYIEPDEKIIALEDFRCLHKTVIDDVTVYFVYDHSVLAPVTFYTEGQAENVRTNRYREFLPYDKQFYKHRPMKGIRREIKRKRRPKKKKKWHNK